jgi:hypothetical protein
MSKKHHRKQSRATKRRVTFVFDDGYGDYLHFSNSVYGFLAIFFMGNMAAMYWQKRQNALLFLQLTVIALWFLGHVIIIRKHRHDRISGDGAKYRQNLRAALTVSQTALLFSGLLLPNSMVVIEPVRAFLVRLGIGTMVAKWVINILRLLVSGILGNFAYDVVKKFVRSLRPQAESAKVLRK